MYSIDNIVVFEVYGRYYADYQLPNGTRFALHRHSCGDYATAKEFAIEEINYLNTKEYKI